MLWFIMHFVNGAQLLNTTLVSALPTVAVMSPVIRLDSITLVSNLTVVPF